MSNHSIGERSELTHRALADPTQRHLLQLLDDAEGPLEASALSTTVGLHPNTVRQHLKQLSQAGLVTRTSENRTPARTTRDAVSGCSPGKPVTRIGRVSLPR